MKHGFEIKFFLLCSQVFSSPARRQSDHNGTFWCFSSKVNFLMWRPLTSYKLLCYAITIIGHVISCGAHHVTFMWSGLMTMFGIPGVIISSLETTFLIMRSSRNISSERKVFSLINNILETYLPLIFQYFRLSCLRLSVLLAEYDGCGWPFNSC